MSQRRLWSRLGFWQRSAAAGAALALLGGVMGAASAVPPSEQAKLAARDGAAYDQFGWSVAVSGDTAVIGAREDDDAGSGSGSAYVFVRSAGIWAEQAKLTASDAAADDAFGGSVAILGDTAVVAASGDDHYSGAVYVFTRSGTNWIEAAKLMASDRAAGAAFGSSVALEGDTVVIGAERDINNGKETGAAYVFTRSGDSWVETAKLTASDRAALDRFGCSAAVVADTLAIGAYWVINDGKETGAAYVFTRSGDSWVETAKLTASDAADKDMFGASLALAADTMVVGTPFGTWDAPGSGSAYVFTRSRNSWSEAARLVPSADAADSESFGGAVALMAADTVLVSRHRYGSVYVYARLGDTWVEASQLTASDGDESSSFGTAVTVSGDTVVIGARGDDDAGSGSGAAYVFQLDPGDPLPCTIMGTAGDDVLVGTSRRDVICGLGGADTIHAGAGNDVVLGGSGSDSLFGGPGDDTILGGRGWDNLYPGRGVDYVDGGSGSRDWVDYSSARHSIVASLRSGMATGQGRDTLVSIENIVGSKLNDKLIGDSRTNRIKAGAGADKVSGRGGNDFLWGGSGPDTLSGGSGSDEARGGSGADTCTAEVQVSC